MVNWEYSESVESQDIVKIKDKYQNFFDGNFQQPNSKKYINTISPSTEEVLSKIVISNEKDVNNAIKSAQMGFEKWSKTSPHERSKYLFKLARLIQERSREFAGHLEKVGGKPLFGGEVERLMLGEVEDLWDKVAIAMYPSRKAMLQMINDPDYIVSAQHRVAGLEGQLNIETSLPSSD